MRRVRSIGASRSTHANMWPVRPCVARIHPMRVGHEAHIASTLGELALCVGPMPTTFNEVSRGLQSWSRGTAERRMIMRTMLGALLGLSLLAGAAGAANAADCRVTGWIDSGQGGRPIFTCTDQGR